jgi:hypothetical protein
MAETMEKVGRELDNLTHVVRNGTVKLESLMCQMEALVKDMHCAVEACKAEIECLIEEDR